MEEELAKVVYGIRDKCGNAEIVGPFLLFRLRERREFDTREI